jgi:uncharacterized protein
VSIKAQDAVLACTQAFYKKQPPSERNISAVVDEACRHCSAEIEKSAQASYEVNRARFPLHTDVADIEKERKSICSVVLLRQANEAIANRKESQREAELARVRAQAQADLKTAPDSKPLVAEATQCSEILLSRYAERTTETAADVAEAAFDGCKPQWAAAADAIWKVAELQTVSSSGVPLPLSEQLSGMNGVWDSLRGGYLSNFKTLAIAIRADVGRIEKRAEIGGSLEDADAAYKRGDYAAAFQLFRALADHGNAEAQYNLAAMYVSGRGTPQDDGQAMHWFQKSAGQGHILAQYSLGVGYENGRGVEKNHVAAMSWYFQAASQGLAAAQNNLGFMLATGEGGVPTNYDDALKWYRKAAGQGLAVAQFSLGVMYQNGQGVPQDLVQAHKWASLAVAGFPPSETETRNRAVSVRDLVAGKMTSAEIAEAQRLAREWKPEPTASGN